MLSNSLTVSIGFKKRLWNFSNLKEKRGKIRGFFKQENLCSGNFPLFLINRYWAYFTLLSGTPKLWAYCAWSQLFSVFLTRHALPGSLKLKRQKQCVWGGRKKASEIPTAVGAGSKYAWILTSLLMAQKWNKYEKLRFFDKRHSSAVLRRFKVIIWKWKK